MNRGALIGIIVVLIVLIVGAVVMVNKNKIKSDQLNSSSNNVATEDAAQSIIAVDDAGNSINESEFGDDTLDDFG